MERSDGYEERALLRLRLGKRLSKLKKDLEHGTISEFDGIVGVIHFLQELLEKIGELVE